MSGVYHAIHIAARDNHDEASDHVGQDDVPSGFRGNSDVIVVDVDSTDDLLKYFDKLLGTKTPVNYLDFHSHGYGGAADLGKNYLNLVALDKFRNRGFENVFAAGATIKFLGCDIANCNFKQEDEDGELFLAEFALLFLSKNGGTCLGSSGDIRYRPSYLFWSAKWTSDGTWVAAEVVAGAREAALKGHYYLDVDRIRQLMDATTALLTAFVEGSTPTRIDSGALSPEVRNAINKFNERYHIKDLAFVRDALLQMDYARKRLGNSRHPPLRLLDDVADTVESAINKLKEKHVEIAQVLDSIRLAIRRNPISS